MAPMGFAQRLALVPMLLAGQAASEVAGSGTETCSAKGGCGTEKLRLSLEWFLNPDHLPLIVANRTGIFEQEGLEVEIIEPDDHFEPLSAIHAGELDVAITETLHLVQDRAKGEEVVGFGRFLHTDGGVMFLNGNGVERPRDMCQLRGGEKTKVAYPGAPGVGGLAIIKTMAEADGGTCDVAATLEPVNNGFYHNAALQEGKADLTTLIFHNFEMVEAKHLGLNASYFSLKHWGVPDFCQLIFITNPKHFAKRKVAMRKLIMSVRKAIDWIKINPAAAKSMYYQWTAAEEGSDKMMDEMLDQTLFMFPNDQSMPMEYYDKLEHWLVETGQVDKAIGVRDYWTNEVSL